MALGGGDKGEAERCSITRPEQQVVLTLNFAPLPRDTDMDPFVLDRGCYVKRLHFINLSYQTHFEVVIIQFFLLWLKHTM